MLRHKNIDRVCCIALALTLLLSTLFVGAAATGLITEDTAIGYENRLFDQSRVHTIDIVMDNWENFQVLRNYQYNNNVTIAGITNSTDGTEGTVTLDHRVNVERGNFTVSVEREAMLDSHIEVRPLRVDIIEKEGINQQVKLFLANPVLPTIPISPTNNTFDWARMEVASSALNETDYCDNGQRKYFTTTLLDELNNSSGNGIIATLNTDNCVWIYFDENLNVSKTG